MANQYTRLAHVAMCYVLGYVAGMFGGSDRQGGSLGITDGERYLFPLCTRAWATGVPPHMLAISPSILWRDSYRYG